MDALECYFCAMRGNGIRHKMPSRQHTMPDATAYDVFRLSIRCFLP